MGTLDAEVAGRALAATKTLARLGVVRAAYVFGSQVEGKADSWSDIDVAAFMEGVEDWDIRKRARAMALVMEEAGSDVRGTPASRIGIGEFGPRRLRRIRITPWHPCFGATMRLTSTGPSPNSNNLITDHALSPD